MGKPLGSSDQGRRGATDIDGLGRSNVRALEGAVNRPLGPKEEEAIHSSMHRGQPFGSERWQAEVAARLGLESLLRPRGRPRKQPNNGS